MNPPTIHIQDSDCAAPSLTLRYIHGENELDLIAVYAAISSLHDPVNDCNKAFFDSFWSTAASLLDYFADFYTADTALMQSTWLHMLDEWQRAKPLLTLHLNLRFPYCNSAQTFEKDYKATLSLFQRLIAPKPRSQPNSPSDPLIHNPSGTVQGPGCTYDTGPFISGLKPWQQFLYSGAPGFTPPSSSSDTIDPTTTTTTTALSNNINNNYEKDTKNPTRYLPQPALALLQTHSSRARTLTTTLAHKHKNTSDPTDPLTAFDAHALSTPHTPYHSYSYTSLTRPDKTISYQLVQGAPPVKRHEGLTDPSMLVEEPGLMLLDEAVGSCRGREAYVSMTGPVGRVGVGFDVWAVVERGGDDGGGGDDARRVFAAALGEMFDEWYFDDDDDN